MLSHFDLIITADYPNRTAELRLLDLHGSQLAFRQTSFQTIAASRQQGLFNLRDYLSHYVEPGREIASVAEIGVCIAEEVLGEEIFRKLWESESQRTLRIQLPGATEEENHLAAALARVPWEIARPAANQPTLGERNLLVRVVHDMQASPTVPLNLDRDESLRVLFVFAEARGSRPLAARQERHELRQLFEREIYPNRRIVADFLTHGVTRERLQSQIEENGGYHIVHWSGHGHLNLLELAKPGGAGDRLSGDQLLDLFTSAGGFIPRLFFLSACHSGDILRAKDWNEFMAIDQGRESVTRPVEDAASIRTDAGSVSHGGSSETKQIEFDAQPGYTGTAHALLQGGVSSVVAMRYAVGDDYARELGIEFYRALLAHAKPKSVAEALTMARNSLRDPQKHHGVRYSVCDHATPVLYGAEQPGLTLQQGRSPGLDTRNPRLHQITELTLAGHEHFVGRTWELAELGSDFIGSSRGSEVKPVAVITGLGGMGKTALTAESLALWESRFEWVLLYQAKPNPLSFEATLRDIDLKLRGELGRYHDHVTDHRADAIHREATAEFTGPERLERLTRNLIRALKDEPILLVLDNFETNLKAVAEAASLILLNQPNLRLAASATCQDPAWDRCLALLASELIDAPSRVLITCRRPLAVLPATVAHHVLLGPLPSGEAALYLRQHAGLSKMLFSNDVGEKALAMRLLTASRFHPLLMDRLARLAVGGESLRPQLLQALDALETSHDYSQLPELFATDPGDAKELAYLNDALATSLDQLIHEASPDARRLLWMIALANDPVSLGLLRGVWSGEDGPETAQLRQIKQMLDMLPQLPAEMQAKLKALPPEFRAVLDALPPEPPARPEIEPLLRHLVSVGLVTEERTGPDDDNPDLTCHELVRERILAWMSGKALAADGSDPGTDRGDLTENAIRLAYAERLEAVFKSLRHENMTLALQAGSRAVVYCVQAEAWDRLSSFASGVVAGTSDPRLLEGLIPHLRTAAESAPEGEPRWSCLCYLADAIARGGRPDTSLPFYEQAANMARAAAVSGTALAAGLDLESNVVSPAATAVPLNSASRQAWADLAWIAGNWAAAFVMTGNLDAARQRQLEAAEAFKNAGRPAIHVIGSELEALRIDIMQGEVAAASPQVETRLAQVAQWWQRHRSGQRVPEAPDAEYLARAYISALDVANDGFRGQNNWESALRCSDAILEVRRELKRPAAEIGSARMNRAVELVQLQRFGEARAELEACLQLFQNKPDWSAKVLNSLAGLFDKQGDVAQAITQQRRALALCEQLPDPADRAMSHNNLAVYLKRDGTPSALAESPRHQLAALIYCLAAGLGQHLQTSLGNYVIRFRRARAAGTELSVPRVAELLADSAFHSLEQWLRQRQIPVDDLQAAVDRFLTQVRQVAEVSTTEGTEEHRGELNPPATRVSLSDTRSPDNERATSPVAHDGVVYPVWFGTNRKPTASGDGFTGQRHDRITHGRVEVYVPEWHRFGETGSSFWQKLKRFDLRDDRLRLQRVETQHRDTFFAEIQAAMQTARESGESPHALFFLHGFNVSFEEAAIRAAQIGFDLKVPGATAFFSWPSRGIVTAYPADEASIESSEQAITDFLIDFTANCGAEKVHVIAHSMGNRGLLRALQRIATNALTQGKVKFGQVFLAAPDVDRDLFLDLARLYPEHAERTTLYASNADLAVHLSARLHDAPRAGYFEPYTVAPGIDTVAVPDFDLDLLGHSYFAQAEALLHDIHDLMRHGTAPAQRQRIAPAVHDGTAFWKLRR